MARITWQNVTAPDFSAASDASARGAGLFARGMENLADVLGDVQTRKRTQASNAATERMLQFGDVDGWDAALKRGGLSAIGITSDMATSDLMKSFQGRREDLEGARNADNRAAQDSFNLSRDQYGQDRRELTDSRADAEFARSEDARLRREWANAEIHKMATGNGNRDAGAVSMDELLLKVRDLDLGAKDNAALMDAARSYDSDEFKIASDARMKNADLEERAGTGIRTLDQLDRAAAFDDNASGNNAVRLWRSASENFGGSVDDPMAQVIDELVTSNRDEEGNSVFDNSEGQLRAAYNRVVDANPEIPEVIIANAFRNNLGTDSVVWLGDQKERIDESRVNKALEPLKTEAGRKELQFLNEKYLVEQTERDDTRRRIGELQSEITLRQGLGQSDAAVRPMEEELSKLLDSINAPEEVAKSDPVLEEQGPSWNKAVEGLLKRNGTSEEQPERTALEEVENTRSGVAGALSGLAGLVDRGIGGVSGAGNIAGGNYRKYLGNTVGLVAPEFGASIVENGRDQASDGRDQLSEGFFGRWSREREERRPEVNASFDAERALATAVADEAITGLSSGNPALMREAASDAQQFIAMVRNLGAQASPQMLEKARQLQALMARR